MWAVSIWVPINEAESNSTESFEPSDNEQDMKMLVIPYLVQTLQLRAIFSYTCTCQKVPGIQQFQLYK